LNVARGKQATIGDERTSQNGYQYVKTPQGWRLKHQIILEEKLGRPLAENERCRFNDGNRNNLDPDNLTVYRKASQTTGKRKAWLEAKIEELQAELDALNEEE
jgi:hypothetical protein